MKYEELTKNIIGCTFRVYNKMGFGFLESVYEKCLLIELRKVGITFKAQHPIRVYYDNKEVGEYFADVFVESCVIVELKSVKRVVKAHEIQLVNYLTATKKDVGLLINFGEKKVEIKRKVRELPEDLSTIEPK